ncbi:hypothetical protein CLOSYM_01452 [[Clostridium] symbiosum ATCC 14940]|uniref:Uncharacterized protein n=1 Tax=[Clostridium] symbiosum ATCC 14940 TaxID=411472 RepID=A0ABC9U0H3_CLOSY|nr:hypothetical protein CLOSYM_01452 [[Clostridium] symbiosum ATCC 14940]
MPLPYFTVPLLRVILFHDVIISQHLLFYNGIFTEIQVFITFQ